MTETTSSKPQADLRIELVLEGIESFANACAAKVMSGLPSTLTKKGEMLENEYNRSRDELSQALRSFVAPLVRVVDGGLEGQALTDEEFKCQKCGASKRCQLDCADWHATIRAAHETADETFPICPMCDCPDDPSILCCEKKCPRKDRGETA